MKIYAHVVPHSHWDREWYMPFEYHRARLVALMDTVLELLKNPDYPCYHLDGQTIPLEDYLEIRPHRREEVEALIRQGRLKVGPWYVLQDTYLTSSEANVRNMLWGTHLAQRFGGVCKIGYLPDAFGNAGQFPQLLCQAGMKAAVFGRGVKLMGKNGVSDLEHLRLRCSEFFWESPDGSRIPSIYFANWYSNGMEIPENPEKAKIWWERHLADARRYAATEHLLFMNGCDHQPVQQNLPQALETARALYPDIEFRQSTLDEYADAVLENLTEPLEVVKGELEGQQTDGHGTLRNTASARWYIKSLNRQNEVLLEKEAEPMAAMGVLAGMAADGDRFDYAWRVLMQNHPHDSICGCSIDEVHREMESRYQRSIHATQALLNESRAALAKRIAAQLPKEDEKGTAFVVWNPSPWERTDVVETVVGVDRLYGHVEAYDAMVKRPLGSYRLLDSVGREIPCRMEDRGVQFGYDLPDDRFRQPYQERQIQLTFEAENLPAFGYAVYYLKEGESSLSSGSLITGQHCMENDFLRVAVNEDGSVDLLDKRTNRVYAALGVLEDVGDVGDEYVFQEALGGSIATRRVPARITLAEDTHARASFRVEHTMRLPVCADAKIWEAMQAMRLRTDRAIGRAEEMAEMRVNVTYTLGRSAKRLDVHVEAENTIRDHRLRMLLPTDISGTHHYADSVFDLVRRDDVPGPDWVNPSRCDHMQLYTAIAGEEGGLGVANRGLYEYEVLPERRTLAITLLRCVGELADWGVFPTPEAQCLGHFEADMSLIPLVNEAAVTDGLCMAHVYQTRLAASCIRETTAELPARKSFLSWQGDGLICTCFKAAADQKGLVLRVFNSKEKASALKLQTDLQVFASDIMETDGEWIAPQEKGVVQIPVGAKKIVTVRLK